LIVCFFVFFCGCSTQKNTFISRSYQNLTAHFNVLFNGNESYKKGITRYDLNYHDDYSRILPVFNYGNKELAKTITSEMDITQKKASKLITLHSIKVKPKMQRGKLSAKEKEILNTNEFNKWVDDAYLNIGRSNFYLMDYDKSYEAFNFTVKEFPKSVSAYTAQIWIARIYGQKGEYRDAEKILTQLETDKKFPKKLKLDYYSTVAHVALKQNQYPQATKALERAMPFVKKRKTKLRFYYILAQLYQQQNRNNEAEVLYAKVIHKHPPYEMAFNAQINRASLVESGSKSSKGVRQKLIKMSRDEKNKDYLDQIYYALGNIEMKDGNTEKAIGNYKTSVSVSKNNKDQKALSCLTLADFFYNRKEYVPAQAYYDTTMQNIDPDYPGINIIQARSESLGRLVENLNTISTQDSLQKVAKMTENDRLRLIDGIISDLKKKEMDTQQAESQRLQDYYRGQNRQSTIPGEQTTAKWYFYNPVSISQGMKDFQLRWGKRKLEDNWRRRNKASNAFVNEEDAAKKLQGNAAEGIDAKPLSNMSREFYSKNLPLTDSLMAVSKHKVLNAYFEAGQVYRNELHDLFPSTELYEEMLKRFPESEYKLPVYYQQYSMYKEMNKTGRSDYYKNLILSQYSNSTYARVISDPEYYKEVEKKDKEAEQLFEQTYSLYNNGSYNQVIANADEAIKKYPNDKVIPNFALLRALSFGKDSNMLAFREELNKVIAKYPNHPVAGHAKEVLTYLNTYKPETKQLEDVKKAEVTYVTDESTSYYFVVILKKTEDLNQISFDIINFNLDNFSNEKLEITRDNFGKEYKLLTIRSFDKPEKIKKYYETFNSKPDVLKNIKSDYKAIFYISLPNYETLLKQPDADSYLQFFRVHFLDTKPGA
jgi:tetratricopeptide (TPR) repeat protein